MPMVGQGASCADGGAAACGSVDHYTSALLVDDGAAAMAVVATVVLVHSMLETAAWLTMAVLLLAAAMTVVLVLSLLEALALLTMMQLQWLWK